MKSAYSRRTLPNRLVGIFCLLLFASAAYVIGCSAKEDGDTQQAESGDNGSIGYIFYGDKLYVRDEERSDCPFNSHIEKLLFNPDGSEVWCVVGHYEAFFTDACFYYATAAVLKVESCKWEKIPKPDNMGTFGDVEFSPDGKTAWLSHSIRGGGPSLFQRSGENCTWTPIQANMPKNYNAGKLWLSPDAKELWAENMGEGLLRIKLATGDVTQYFKREKSPDRDTDQFPLFGNCVKDVVFTKDCKYAVCSCQDNGGANDGITIIELESGRADSYPTELDIDEYDLEANQDIIHLAHYNEQGGLGSSCLGSWNVPTSFNLSTREWIPMNITNAKQETIDETKYDTEEELAALDVSDKQRKKIAMWTKDRSAWNAFGALIHKDDLNVGWIDDYENRRIIYVQGTAGKYSVCVFDKKTKTGKKIADVDLPHSFDMALGPRGKVWLTLGGGLMSVNPDTGEVKRYE